MKNALIIVGKALKHNPNFTAYLQREVVKSLGTIDMILYMDKNDESMASHIKDVMNVYEHVIIATVEGFELVGKIVSTHTSDTLVYKEKMLLPLKSTAIVENSYRVQNINVLHVNVTQKIPQILIQTQKESRVFLFCSEEAVMRFETLARLYEITCSGVSVIDDVWHYSLERHNAFSVEHFLKDVKETITHKIVIGDDLSSIIANRLIEVEKTITFAESCTGGLIASELVKNSGVSSIFKGSIGSYTNEVKSGLVGVNEETLIKYGAVSKECVGEMLDGVMKKFDSDFAIAVSGVAGPDGGTKEKPVGTVIIGAKSRESGRIIRRLHLQGDRVFIQKSSLSWALRLLMECDEKFFFKFVLKTLDK